MKDINLLIEKLKKDVEIEDSKEAFRNVICEISKFYTENLNVKEEEISILLVNNDKAILSFVCPSFLIDSGMIPVSSDDALASKIFKTGRPLLENNLQAQKHLNIFEMIPTPDNKVKPIWKMIGALIYVNDEKLGVIEVSRRSLIFSEAGEDFLSRDLDFLEKTMFKFAPFIKKTMPKDLTVKIS
jgi:hypothetical protein